MISRYLLYNFKTARRGMSPGFFQTLFVYCIWDFFRITFTIHRAVGEGGRLILIPFCTTSTRFTNT